MDGGVGRRASAPRAGVYAHGFGLIAAVVLALGSAACNPATIQTPILASGAAGPTVAFESVDGPPQSIYTKLVHGLSQEAKARRIAVVSRGEPAHYRIRIYAAKTVYPKRSVVHWVWDVYDADRRRAHRFSGEETVKGAGRNTWAAVDEQMTNRIASRGMEQLAAFLRSSNGATAANPAPRAPAPPLPAEPGIAVAVAR